MGRINFRVKNTKIITIKNNNQEFWGVILTDKAKNDDFEYCWVEFLIDKKNTKIDIEQLLNEFERFSENEIDFNIDLTEFVDVNRFWCKKEEIKDVFVKFVNYWNLKYEEKLSY